MTRARIRTAELVVLAGCVLLGGFLLGYPRISFSPDANEYVAFSDAILDGELFSLRGGDVPQALAIRTPGYPLVLSAVRGLGLGTKSAVGVTHAALALAALLCVPLLLRSYCPVWLSAPGVLVALHGMRQYYGRPITEWFSLTLLLLLFALCVRHVEGPSPRRLFAIGLASAAIVLTRPALIAVGLFPVGFALFRGSASARQRALVVGASLSPIFLWMGFNLYRLGAFTLSPFAGPNLFGVAALVGHASARDGDDPELVRFIEHINRGKNPAPGERLALDAIGMRTYNFNIHKLAEPLAEERGYDQASFNRMLLVYSFRSIRANPRAYLGYVLHGLRQPMRELALLFLPVGLLPIFWLVRGKHRGLAVATLAFLGLHVVHMLLCASAELMIARYRLGTSCPLYGLAVVTGGEYVLSLARSARSRPGPHRPEDGSASRAPPAGEGPAR